MKPSDDSPAAGAAASNAARPQCHPAFEHVRSQNIDSLGLCVEEYRHRRTGALHFHLAADHPENVFLVAFRTVPMDSTGVAHILEHTALCGSERYPVRDPFFMMIRRSLNTFMNAFTSSDWTAYPFASQNEKDFYNLMDVYLDAAFFARLDELDFAQEGHRIEVENPADPASPLVYKGVVFNEMKGAMSSPVSVLWHTLCEHLFPTTTYHYNSGGDPKAIPDLRYEDLKEFYRTHYHPSNAIFMTFGSLPAVRHQQRMEERALHRFDRLDEVIEVHDEVRLREPVSVSADYALEEEDTSEKTHVVLGWLLGRSTDLDELLRAHLLTGILLDNSASPLRHALETTSLGSAPSPLCGLEDGCREMVFVCGLEGTEPERADDIERLVLETLERVARDGVPLEQAEAALHQLELHRREIGGDGYPYGLQLILNALPAAIHRGDLVAVLHLDPALERLRSEIRDPGFIPGLVRSLLIDNAHRVRLTLKPDPQLARRQAAEEAERLAAIAAQLDAGERQRLIERAAQLAERQARQDDPDILPRVGREDIPADIPIPHGEDFSVSGRPLAFYAQGTNGLVYQQIIAELPTLEGELLDRLPHYTRSLTEVGCGGMDYLQTQLRQDRVCGGISAYTSMRGRIDDAQDVRAHFVLSGKALADRHADFAQLMRDTLETVRFDELARLRELVSQERARMEQSVTGNGHSLAMTAASSGLSPVAAISHRLRGLEGIRLLKKLDDELADDRALKLFAEELREIHRRVLAAPRRFLVVGEAHRREQLLEELAAIWSDQQQAENGGFRAFGSDPVARQVRQMWVTSTQVNFCARVYPTVPLEHEDAAALEVLGPFLRNGFLHRAIREQGGAYGGGAGHDGDLAVFRFYSYRDPRLTGTLEDFDRAIDWLLAGGHSERQLEEAILGVIGSIDKPGSPAGEAKSAFHNMLYGRTPEQRRRYRARVLAVTIDDLLRVAETWLRPERASQAVITSPATLESLGALDMEVCRL